MKNLIFHLDQIALNNPDLKDEFCCVCGLVDNHKGNESDFKKEYRHLQNGRKVCDNCGPQFV